MTASWWDRICLVLMLPVVLTGYIARMVYDALRLGWNIEL